ncbi:helix-turn-helix domain-containing protein [Yinghuangia soli]|uniref:Helix-turn-helix transcriptional regulator n=1 Tax=Yinghuangia soli TaxID=2908204 RepID=A0AA41Q564_9ACTN|nr:helix-turn-helix transcriptional regulator [Yinghuangia soli]MCF2531768.1 helix-turn-helix transcriptional regulator [Yinghuangia soli]
MSEQSSSVAEARRALAQRLREIRLDAGLTARALAGAAGWHESKCSRLEHGRTPPSDADLRAWTRYCGVPGLAPDLIAAARGIDGMYVEWRRMERAGLRHAQESVVPLWERTRQFRIYSSWLIPGPVQTPAYIRALLTALRDRRQLADDIDAAVEVRVAKQALLHGPRQFAVLLEESALRVRIGGAETMAGQLGHLLAVASLPSVSLGIIPAAADRSALWPTETFFMFDSEQVAVELVSAHLTVTQPREIRMYEDVFAALAELAVYGADARALITAAITALG